MKQVSITRHGKTYIGTYTVTKGILTVRYNGKSKPAHLGNTNPQMLAEQLLSEMPKG